MHLLYQALNSQPEQGQCQVPRIGRQLGERLSAAGITTLQELQQAGARHIESIIQRNYPFGRPALPGIRVCASSMVVLSLSG